MTSSGFHAEAARPDEQHGCRAEREAAEPDRAEQRPQGQDPEEQDQRFGDQQVDAHGLTIGRPRRSSGLRWSPVEGRTTRSPHSGKPDGVAGSAPAGVSTRATGPRPALRPGPR